MTTPSQPNTRREHDLTILAAGGHTGWLDQTGEPAPFPDHFFDPDTDWRPETNPAPGEQPL